jgi:hypothetical protein
MPDTRTCSTHMHYTRTVVRSAFVRMRAQSTCDTCRKYAQSLHARHVHTHIPTYVDKLPHTEDTDIRTYVDVNAYVRACVHK